MEDLREKTHEKHYELYRKMRLEQVNFFILLTMNDLVNNIVIYFVDGL